VATGASPQAGEKKRLGVVRPAPANPTSRKAEFVHLKVIACEVMARELFHCAARARNTLDIELCPQGFHDNAEICRTELQGRINATDPEQFQAILLGYFLCSNSTVGVAAGGLPLVIPRGHDCITMLLGSRERYAALFEQRPGTYYFSSGWLEYPERGGKRVPYDQRSGLAPQQSYHDLVAKYGEDNARYLAEMLGGWEQHYTHGTLIDYGFINGLPLEARVKEICAERGWEFARILGDLTLMQRWLDGDWSQDDYLVLQPGQRVAAAYDDRIIRAQEEGGA
jgi:hypothetical protein